MKRIYSLIYFLILVLSAYSQTTPAAAGVSFGESYEQCKETLDVRFNNGKESYQLTANELSYRNIQFGGTSFDYVDFDFQATGGQSRLCKITFVSRFNLSDSKYAKGQRDKLFATFREKYEFRWDGVNDDGYAYYVLGHNPKEPEDGLIVIETWKGRSNGGEMFLWTSLTYGPVYMVDVKDEI